MPESYILAIDQGTSGTKAIIFDSNGRIISKATKELKSYFPQAGFVEQDPNEIYNSVLDSIKLCLKKFSQDPSRNLRNITTCGISNQRETFLLWNKKGNPLCRAILWQCKRSVDICDRIKSSELEDEVIERTGLIIDPYFSGTKLIWLYENDHLVKNAIDAGDAYFGTVDTWLLFKLTQGQSYFTDYTNASRTLLFNINNLQWDDYLLNKFNLKKLNLPQPQPSSHLYGRSDFDGLLPEKINISAMIGDSHAAAFGEGCFSAGMAKATMGTGSSILLNTGSKRIKSKEGMVATICWSTSDRIDYAIEGIIVTCGATINWLRDQLGIFTDSRQTEEMALSVENNNGVYLVPAFSGLGAPYWKMDLRAAILGLTFGCDKNHIVRAALESICYQIKDVIAAMEEDSGIKLKELKVDGGITANHFVMQFLADLLKTNIVNIGIEEVSALGAAYLAGLQVGIFTCLDQLKNLSANKNQFYPSSDTDEIDAFYEGWKKAVQQLL
ncbi:MAG: carbohydrate kinase [Planctomycetes bacterium RBG_13_44_8b]|nr:MAG: carbohydrate kinase [Planctomycetes bacterium RBG_13_44_8b]